MFITQTGWLYLRFLQYFLSPVAWPRCYVCVPFVETTRRECAPSVLDTDEAVVNGRFPGGWAEGC